jgi:hypothetical protein
MIGDGPMFGKTILRFALFGFSAGIVPLKNLLEFLEFKLDLEGN